MKEDIIEKLEDELEVEVLGESGEWKTPTVVVEENDGTVTVTIRADSKPEILDIRDKVKAALEPEHLVGFGIIEFNPFECRYWQRTTIF